MIMWNQRSPALWIAGVVELIRYYVPFLKGLPRSTAKQLMLSLTITQRWGSHQMWLSVRLQGFTSPFMPKKRLPVQCFLASEKASVFTFFTSCHLLPPHCRRNAKQNALNFFSMERTENETNALCIFISVFLLKGKGKKSSFWTGFFSTCRRHCSFLVHRRFEIVISACACVGDTSADSFIRSL